MMFLAIALATAAGADKPAWVAVDYRSPEEWGFYCEGSGKTEAEALQAAELECAHKICMLFGVEVDAQTQSKETLKEIAVTSTVIERCPAVRVRGRKDKKKSVSCEESDCHAFLWQTYPKSEYDAEYARLNAPAISKVLEKTIIVIEGSKTFKDPKECREDLVDYAALHGESDAASTRRVEILQKAGKSCAQLDYRDVPLQTEFIKTIWSGTGAREVNASLFLAVRLGKESSVEGSVAALRRAEEEMLRARTKTEELRRFMLDHFDILKTPFADEEGIRSASKLYGLLVQKWPASLAQEIRVCAMRRVSRADTQDREVCFSLTPLSVRAELAQTACWLQARENQHCMQELYRALTEACPDLIDQACFQKASLRVKEATSVTIGFPTTEKGL